MSHRSHVKILNTKMHYDIGIYFQGGVSQLEKYCSYRNCTVDYLGKDVFDIYEDITRIFPMRLPPVSLGDLHVGGSQSLVGLDDICTFLSDTVTV